jgi:hypothetical protein
MTQELTLGVDTAYRTCAKVTREILDRGTAEDQP